jgi:hypothetical protein
VKARSKQPSVTDSPHPKRQDNVDTVAAALDKPKNRDSSFRGMCLQRDGYRCVVTGHMDIDYWEKLGCLKEMDFRPLKAAHIIPFDILIVVDIRIVVDILYCCQYPAA